MKYRPRIADSQIARCLNLFGAVLIEGPKWCGKTWAARNASASEFSVADPEGNFRNREIALLNPQAALEGSRPHLVDEWQEVPLLWDAVRAEVDRSDARGQFILTGSSTPDDDRTLHSGAGRVGRIRLETMSLSETGISQSSISLRALFDQPASFTSGEHIGSLTLTSLAESIVRGGWPALVGMPAEDAAEIIDSYLDTIAELDISKIDGTRRDPGKVKALLRSLARNTASTVRFATLSKDIAEFGAIAVSDSIISEYLSLLKRLFIVRDVPAWEPALKSTIRLRSTPKRIFADASLAASALGANAASLQADPKLLGSLFENQVLHDLIVYAGISRAEVRQYRDNSGLETDAIIERRDGSWAGIEIKLGYHSEDEAAETLLRLKRKLDGTGQKPPAFLAVVVGVGALARLRDDGIYVIPIDHLGP
ncbi:MAG: DUF4143 domain-containing protein [Coriobacteriales bacterium]|jgi:predicted AAA+ superfamily ATPase|nr:DUF4143 domain-containing protein [Coriobacteriales bacterium]